MRRLSLLLFLLLITLPSSHVIGTDSNLPLIAATRPDGHLYVFNLDDEPIRVTEDPIFTTYGYINPYSNYNHIWSPDGTKLAFVEGKANVPIGIYDTLSRETWYLDVEANGGVPMSFSTDGGYIYFSSWGNPERDGELGESYVEVYENGSPSSAEFYPFLANRIAVDPDAEYETLDVMYYLPDGLGGIGECYGNYVLAGEGLGLNFGAILTEDIVMNSYWNSRETIDIPEALGASLNYERSHIIYRDIRAYNLILTMSVENNEVTQYVTQPPPHFTAWVGEEHPIFYTQIEVGEDLFWYRYDEIEEQFWSIYDCMFSSNTASIYQLNPSTGEDELIYQDNHYAIASIMPDPNDEYLYFTAISDVVPEWMERMIAEECEDNSYCTDMFYPDLYRLDLATGEAELILEDVFKARIAFTE